MKTEILTPNELNFNEIYAKYHNEVLNYIKFKMNNKHKEVAEEICNDTFLKSQKYVYNESLSKITTWLKGIAGQLIIDYYRSETIIKTSETISDEGELIKVKERVNVKTYISNYVNDEGIEFFEINAKSDTSAKIENSQLLTSVKASFDNLKPKYQEIARLRFVEEYSYNEIAEMLNIPENTVKQQILRAKEMLKTQLETVGASYSLR
jgi:RNA polymerase sigma-70 factor (ECF subfamily)